MMRIFFTVSILILFSVSCFSQDSLRVEKPAFGVSRFCLDLNALTGIGTANYSGLQLAGFPNYIKSNSVLKVSNSNIGFVTGAGVDASYFLGKKRSLGISLGLMYSSAWNNLGLDSFHVEYKRTDAWGNTYRQLITANNENQTSSPGKISENLRVQLYSLPVLIQYRIAMGRKTSLDAGAGVLINFMNKTNYNTNAVFDYEALYAYDNATRSYYYNTTANASGKASDYTYLITKNNVRDSLGYFGTKNSEGYNVGSQISPSSKSGSLSYPTPTIGWICQLHFDWQIAENIYLRAGGYYLNNNLLSKTDYNNNWEVTDAVGSYSSLVKGANHAGESSYGVSVGLRMFIGKLKDSDGDGIPDKRDDCVFISGAPGNYKGCPDFDGDGIPDKDDACPTEKGPACTMGCPDRDNDCIADKVDSCPDEAGSVSNHGCKYEHSKTSLNADDSFVINLLNYKMTDYWTAEELGRPVSNIETTNELINAMPKDSMVYLQTPGEASSRKYLVLKNTKMYFKYGKSSVSEEDYKSLDEAITALKNDTSLVLLVSGFTDDVGSDEYNILLSVKRAESIQNYCKAQGLDEKRIIVSGYGKKYPEMMGISSDARARNRRIEIKVMLPVSK